MQDVNQPGIYIQITDQSTVARARTPWPSPPMTISRGRCGPPVTLNCVVSLADLGGANSSAGPTIAYSGRTPGDGDQHRSDNDHYGYRVFTLSVLNTDNGCLSTDQITIALDTLAPAADAGPAALLNCFSPNAVLDGSGSSRHKALGSRRVVLGGLVLGSS
ncbi:MAG: hypothetical protein IPJ00_18570 [Saprospirales bacterium]|nr:hypothetical protein [Saprospirales bacterium]